MFAAGTTREEFLGIVQGEKLSSNLFHQRDRIDAGFSGDMLLLWAEEPREELFPSAVVLRRGEVRDFLAWAATYLTSLRPFTAFCRVSDLETAVDFTRRRERRAPRDLQSALVGVILGEAAAQGEVETARDLTVRNCLTTCSYVIAKSLWLGTNESGLDQAGSAWVRAREITRQPRFRAPFSELRSIRRVVATIFEGSKHSYMQAPNDLPPGIFDLCLSLYHGAVPDQSLLERLGREFQTMFELVPRVQDTREQRVVMLESALQGLSQVKEGRKAAFIAGYFVSQIAPGTMDHLGLLKRVARSLPSAYIWYGLCAALQQPNNLANFGNGLGRRILREIIRAEDFLDKPKCDVALQELEMLKGDLWPSGLKTTVLGQMDIEISPCVVTSMDLEGRAENVGELFPSQIELFETIKELDVILDRVARTRERLNQAVGGQSRKVRKR